MCLSEAPLFLPPPYFHFFLLPSLPPTIPPLPSFQQSHSLTRLQMLLQYVIFPADDQLNCVTTELWVEPQYGCILETPPTLDYLKGLQHTQISDKVCSQGKKGCGHKMSMGVLVDWYILFL